MGTKIAKKRKYVVNGKPALQAVRLSYTEVLVSGTRRGKRTTWSPKSLGMGIEPFQLIADRLLALESSGVVRIVAKRVEARKARRRFEAIEFVRQ